MPSEVSARVRGDLPPILRKVSRQIQSHLRRTAPRDTGALRRSIYVGPGSILMNEYGFILDARGRHQGWIEQRISEATRRG